MAEKRHPGISMHKLTVGAGFEGLVFTIGCGLIFVFGLPALWYFVAFSAALGIGVAVFLGLSSKHRSERMKPLSILAATEQAKSSTVQKQDKHQQIMLHPLPGACST